jgi:chitodextrinase
MAKTTSGTSAATRTHGCARSVMLAAASVLAVATMATLGSAGGSYALWSSTATVNAGVLSSGSISASMAVSPALTATLKTSSPTQTGFITVSNGGTVGANYAMTATVSSASSAGLAAAIGVNIWSTTTPLSCANQPALNDGFSGTLSTIPSLAMSGTLAAGASATYCARTTLNSATGLTSGSAVDVSFGTALTVSSWSSSASATLTQRFIDDQAPVAPTGLAVTDITSTSAKLSWSASSDNVAVSRYKLYRGTDLNNPIATVEQPPLGFIDLKLAPDTAYSYTVTAEDAAGNVSPASTPPLSFTTLKAAVEPPTDPPVTVIEPSAWYQIKAGDAKCLDTNASTKLQKKDCAQAPVPAEQLWQFQGPNTDGNYRVVSGTSVAWQENKKKADEVALGAVTNSTPYQWRLSGGVNGEFRFTFSNGLCMQHPSNANIALASCTTSAPDLLTFVVTLVHVSAQGMLAAPVAEPAPPAVENLISAAPETLPVVELSSASPEPSLPTLTLNSVPVAPVAPAAPIAPVVSAAPAAPVAPVAPVVPAALVVPIAPVVPAALVVPIAPVVPAAPAAPVAPVVPAAPAAPVAPVVPAAPAVPATEPATPPGPTPPPVPVAIASTPALPVEQVPSPESVRKTNETSQEPVTPPAPAVNDAVTPSESASA